MRYLPPAYIGFILCVLMLSYGFGGAPVIGDPDTAWHLAAGDLIRSLHNVPTSDPWSFTAGNETWYNLSWLFDLGLSRLFSFGGFPAIYVVTLLAFSLCVALMAHHCIRAGAGPASVFLCVLLVMLITYVAVLARPNLCSMLLTLAFYLILEHFRREGRERLLLWLPLLMALWVNLHGGFLMAYLILGLFWVEAMLRRDRYRTEGIALAIAACLATSLLNPYGFEVYYGAYKTLASPFDQQFVLEWKPVEIGRHLPMTLLLLLVLAFGDARDRRIPFVDRALAVLLLLLALSSVRHAALAALMIMPYLSRRLALALNESRFAPSVHGFNAAVLQDMRKPDVKALGAAFALIAFLLLLMPMPRDALLGEPLGFPKKAYPVAEAEYITQHYPHLRFFNDYNIGGYLVYLWRGSTKVFIDGRASSLYGREVLQDYPDFAYSGGFGPRATLIAQAYQIDGVIVLNEARTAGDWLWNPRWKPVFRGPVATVYVRSDLLSPPPARHSDTTPHWLRRLKSVFK